MIDLNLEKESLFSAADIYGILDISMQYADENSFLNYYVYERCVMLNALKIYNPELLDEIADLMEQNVLEAWDKYLQNGELKKMYEDPDSKVSTGLDLLLEASEDYFYSYKDFVQSIRAVAVDFSQVVGKGAKDGQASLANIFTNDNVEEIREIADKWGINNKLQ